MTPSQYLFYFCLSFILGIFISSFFQISIFILLLFLILVFILISVFSKYKNFLFVGLCILFFALGIFRFQDFLLKTQKQEIREYIGKEISMIGVVDDEPKARGKLTMFVLKTEKGKILVKATSYPPVEYGEKVKIRGILKEPATTPYFNWKNYLLKDGILVETNFPKIEKTGENVGNPIKKVVLSFKQKTEQVIKENLPPLHAALLKALLFGQEEDFSKEWKEKLNQTGTRHIVAVSGMNITIICSLILNFLLLFRLWRHQAFFLSLFLIILYIVMIGAPASAVRAGVMGILYLTAQYFGRISSGERPVVFAGALMLLFNPLLLRYDIGFQLSFLAILGIVYFYPFFLETLKKFPNIIKENLATTLSAQLFTLPILIYNFGQFSLISPITNILILPILPTITILGFVFTLFGIIFQPLGYLFSFFCYFLLSYILKVIDIFSQFPFSFITLKVNFLFLVFSYSILIFLAFYFNKRFSQPLFLR